MKTSVTILLSMTLAALLANAEEPAENGAAPALPSAISNGYRLTVTKATIGPSPWDKTIPALTVDMGFECLLPGEPFPHKPPNMFLDSHITLVHAVASDGTDCANNRHFGWTDNYPPSVTLNDLELPSGQRLLKTIVVSVPIVHVKKWKLYTFQQKDMEHGVSHVCGPQQLKTQGTETSFTVGAWMAAVDQGQTRSDAKSFAFLHHGYALHEVEVSDAAAAKLGDSLSYTGGGSGWAKFFIPDPSVPFSNAGKKIAYPVTVTLKMPEQADVEAVVFTLTDVTGATPRATKP